MLMLMLNTVYSTVRLIDTKKQKIQKIAWAAIDGGSGVDCYKEGDGRVIASLVVVAKSYKKNLVKNCMEGSPQGQW